MNRRLTLVALTAALAVAVPVRAFGQAPAAPRNPHLRLAGRACTSCHTTSSWNAVEFDHHVTAFPLLGQHLTVPCAGCHDLKDFRGAPAACGSCHADPHRGDAGARCEQCHDATAWQNVSAQNAHARTRLPDLGVHAALRCDDCHRRSGAHPFTGQVTECVACHRAAYDATSRPAHRSIGIATECRTCHQFTTWDGALFRQHDAIFGIYSGRHAGVWRDCASCHADPMNFTVFGCTTCHGQAQSDRGHQGVPAYQWESSACLACHPGARPATSLEHDAIFPIFSGTHAGQWTACSACHSDPADRKVISCVTGACHARTTTDGFHDRIPGYQYVTAQCRTCHPDGRAGTFTAHDAIFPVFSGTHSGQWTACTACHTDPASRAVYSCTTGGCHAQATTTQGHTGIPGYQWASTQCLSCHHDGRVGAFTAHDGIFPVYSGTHAGQWTACSACHIDPTTRSVYSCTTGGCHAQVVTSQKHTGIPGYAYISGQCLSCHPDGRVGAFTAHDGIFPVYSGTHAGQWTACSACHTDPTTRSVYSCTTGGCHAQTATTRGHTGIPGYQYASTQCVTCHPDGRVGTFTAHDAAFFPVYSGTHAGQWTACSACHTDPTSRAVYSCTTGGCHAQATTTQGHTGITGYQYASAQCLSCHPDGRVGTFTAHDAAYFPIYSGTHTGQWSACSACHTDPTSRAVFSCTTGGCHAQATTTQGHTGIPGYEWTSAQCLSCHPDGRVPAFPAHDATYFPIYSGTHTGQWSACSACHTDPTSRAVYSCTTGGCHAQVVTSQKHTGIPGYAYISGQCLSCHPDGRVGTFTAHDAAFFPVYSGTHAGQWSACSACHTDPTSRAVYSCTTSGCHAQATTTQGHTGIPGYAYISGQCLSCHPDGRVGAFTAHDAAFFPVYIGTHAGQWTACSACHTDPTTRSVYSCITGGCHAQPVTTQGHTGVAGYQYVSAQCLTCHPDGRVPEYTAHDAAYFPIYSGTHMGQWWPCAACHTNPTTRSVYSCITGGCHAQPVTTQGHTGVVGYQYVSAQCLSCHPDGRVPEYTAHDASYFPIYSGTHAGQWTACASCHSDPTTRAVYSCTTSGCHAQTATTQGHTGIPGYAYISGQCLSCHPDGRVGTFTAHDAAFFPIYSGTHTGQWSACSACHTDPTTRSVYSCTTGGCHAQTATTQGHTGIAGYQWASAQCLTCHPDGRVGTFTAHDAAFFPIYSGTHAGQWTACAACHTDPTSRAVYSCTTGGCHAQPVTTQGHTGVAGYQYVSAQCLTCHPDGRVGTFTAHDAAYFPIYSGTHTGQWTACAACHTDPTTRAVYACTSGGCHAQTVTTQSHTGVTGYQWASTQCLSCHPDGRVPTFTAHDAAYFPIYSGTHVGQWTACAACHTDPTTRSVYSCTTGGCHAQATTTQGHTGIPGYAYISGQCLSCHPDGRVGTFTAHDAAFFPVYSGTHVGQWSACSACHTDPTTRSVYSCTTGGCHAQATTTQGHTGIPGYQWASAQCLTCHPDGRIGTFTAHDAAFFPVYSGTHAGQWTACAACHTDPTSRAVYSCTTGGCHAQTATTQGHTGITGYQYASVQCLSCHPDGRVPTYTAHDAAYFPIYSGTHVGQWSACAACHTDPTSRAIYSCTTGGCHAQTVTTQSHTGVTGYQYASTQCLSCHPDGRVPTYTAHDAAYFPIYSGTHVGKWSACAACHTDPTSRAIYSCTTGGCHAQATTTQGHTGIPGYQWASTQCLTCHPDGRVGTFTAHDATLFPIYSGTHAGQWTACAACHTDPSSRAVYSCTTGGCHAQTVTTQGHTGVPSYQYASAQCLSCHPDGRVGAFTAHDATLFPIYSGTHAGQWTACAACHTDPTSRTVYSCTSGGCHAQTVTTQGHTGITGYQWASAQCLSCHPTGLVGTFTAHDASFFPVYSGTHAGQWSACSACHTDPTSRAVYSCVTAGCHAQAATNLAHTGVPSYGYTSAQCLTCHPTGLVGTFTQHDALFFPIYSGTHAGRWSSCLTCHTTKGNPTIFTCMSSGCHPRAQTNSNHSDVKTGYQYLASACYSCHPRGRAGNVAPRLPTPQRPIFPPTRVPPGLDRLSRALAPRAPAHAAELVAYAARWDAEGKPGRP